MHADRILEMDQQQHLSNGCASNLETVIFDQMQSTLFCYVIKLKLILALAANEAAATERKGITFENVVRLHSQQAHFQPDNQ